MNTHRIIQAIDHTNLDPCATEEEILAFAATSNVMTNVTGLYMELFIALPLANLIYKGLSRTLFARKSEPAQ